MSDRVVDTLKSNDQSDQSGQSGQSDPPPPYSDVKVVLIEDEMKRSYLDYAMSVIVSRALPDVRDGLKPVHRRILYAMKEAGNDYNRPYRKSANVVGNVMGKYHPHGNAPIYEAMVRLKQEFNLRVPLIDGQGNFGSIDGDPPAAERYTEARLSRAAHHLLEDIDKNTVDFQSNYDETTVEPRVLPARFPNLLVNGANGIAVGMATSIPPHNLGEVIDACCALIDNPDLDVLDLLNYVKGPDFPTGGVILGRSGILEAYRTGRGSISTRGVAHIEKIKSSERESIIITEIPYQVNKARMIEKIAELVREKTVEGISEIRDESDRDGIRVAIDLRRDANAEIVLNQLYRFSPLQSSFSCNVLALLHGRPEQLPLKKILQSFLDFREDVIVRRTRYDLEKARERSHILVGLAITLSNIDDVIHLIRSSKDRRAAKEALMVRFFDAGDMVAFIRLIDEDLVKESSKCSFTEAQVDAILDLRLHRLTNLEQEKIQKDLTDISKIIQDYLTLLSLRENVLALLKSELLEIKGLFGTERKTIIEESSSMIEVEDLIQEEDMVITISHEGYIKRVSLSTYRSQKRGGRGRSGMTTKEEDVVHDIFVANTHDMILFFSTKGRVYQAKVYKLPIGTPQSKGRAIVNLFPLSEGERIATILVAPQQKNESTESFLMFATSFGHVRRNRISDFSRINSNGKHAITLDEGELLVEVALCRTDDDVLLSTHHGFCNRFPVDNVRVFSGRDSNGVRGIRLLDKDCVISMAILSNGKLDTSERDLYLKMANQARHLLGEDEEGSKEGLKEILEEILSPERFLELQSREQFILTVSENGYGKRSSAYSYRTTLRGSQGFANMTMNERNGKIVASFPVHSNDHIMLVTDQGRLIRCPVEDIRIAGRRTQGVLIFRVDADEKVVAISRIPESADDGEGEEGDPLQDLNKV